MNFNSRVLPIGLFCAVLAFFLATPASAQIPTGQVGVSLGGNFETLDDVSGGNTEATVNSSVGFHVGISYDQPVSTTEPLNALSIRPGFVARRVAQYGFPSSIEGDAAELLQDEEFTLWMLEVPIDARYEFPVEAGPATLYGLLGPQISIPRADHDFEATLNDVSYSINIGVGGEFDLPAGLSLMPEFRYEIGVTDAFKDDFTYRFRDFSIDDSPNFGGPQLRVHLTYGL